ncbi:MAG: hypothetical protein AB1938_00155 [Myxococcota bacterium]
MKKRLPFLIMLGLGFVLWRSGFGFFASERTLTWRLPVPYGDVRRLELQVWSGEELLGRQEASHPAGLGREPELKLALERGDHRAVASVWLLDAGTPESFQTTFDPGADSAVVIDLKRSR